MNHIYAHYSNRMEMLYQLLKEHLFSGSHPLTKRAVIVPSPAMKSWLTLQMARDPEVGIAAGIDIDFIEPMFQKICGWLGPEERAEENKSVPTQLELALAIEAVIKKVARAPRMERSDWLPLFHYIGIETSEKNPYSKKVMRRIFSLASTLAPLFLNYGVYGEKMIADWLIGKEWQWQKLLWDEMESIFSMWNYPARQFSSFTLQTDFTDLDFHIHIFGVSFFPPLYHRFLQKIAQRVPVRYYVFSPCQKFWGDLLSDREGVKLKHYWKRRGATALSQENLEEYLRDRNPLLANYGRLGRENCQQIDNGNPQSSEVYLLPEAIANYASYEELTTDEITLQNTGRPLTLLEVVQSDIALLRNPVESGKIELESYDRTIQVHAAPKKIREVQAIYDTLMGIIDQHKNDSSPILPGDVFVMAQNISDYVPFIKSIFESAESQLPIQLFDYQIPMQYPLIRGYLHLLKLAIGRWEASALLQLFEYDAFRNRFQFSFEDITTIKKWIKKAEIYWGRDSLHRSEVMEQEYQQKGLGTGSSEGTWENGFSRLLEALVMAVHDREEHEVGAIYDALDDIDASQGPLLGKMIDMIHSLQEDLKPLSHHTLLPLQEWSAYLKCVLDAYFSPMTENGPDEGYKVLSTHLGIFASAAVTLREETFAFESVFRHLEDNLQRESTVYRESNLQSVRFSSLLPMRAVPAKVVVMMGMEEGSFPRVDQASAMNLLLNSSKADYFPEAVDFDRYLFLEALLSARDYFVISYVSQEPGDTKEVMPSLLINELLDYLDKAVVFSNSSQLLPSHYCFLSHPLDPFHCKYFSEGSALKTYFRSHYLAALAFHHPEKAVAHSFITHFTPGLIKPSPSQTEILIHLTELLSMAKNPIKFYLNKGLGIHLKKESDRKVKDSEDLFLSELQAAILLRESLSVSETATLAQVERSGRVPNGSFRPVGLEKFTRDEKILMMNLKQCGVDKSQLFSIECNDRYQLPHFANQCWHVPPLIIDRAEQGQVKIVGTIEIASPQGMMILAEGHFEKAVAHWPAVLFFTCLVVKHRLPIALQSIFLKGDRPEVKPLDFEHPEVLLERYLDYYLRCTASPSPLMTDWVEPILSGNVEKVCKEFERDSENEYRQYFDEYKRWLERTSPGITPEPIDHWQPVAQHLFQDMVMKWYPNIKQIV